MPARDGRRDALRGPAYENLQARKPRERRERRCDRAARLPELWGFESCGLGVGERRKRSGGLVKGVGVPERSVS